MGFIIALGKTLYHIVFEKYYLQVSWVPHETWQQHITYNMTFYGPNITRHQNNSLNIMSFTVYITIFDKPKYVTQTDSTQELAKDNVQLIPG